MDLKTLTEINAPSGHEQAIRRVLLDELKKLGFTVVKPSGTFYIFPKALEEDANAFCKKAMKYDLALVPGDSFGCPGYFRLSYCVSNDMIRRSLPAFRAMMKECR